MTELNKTHNTEKGARMKTCKECRHSEQRNFAASNCGENIGTYCRKACQRINSRNKLDCFEPEQDPETELRELWTRQGVSKAKQDELIAETVKKAQPGAKIGPFTIGEPELFEMPFNLIQDTEQDGQRVQAEKDRTEQERKRNESAQRIFFVKPGVLNQAKGEEV